MGYIDKNLLKNEVVLYRTKKHLIVFFMPLVLTAIAVFFLVNSNPYIVKIAVFPAIAAIVSWGNQLLEYFTAEFAITDKRILMKEGFFFRHANDTRLMTIATVTVNQSLLGQILNYGTVVINTYGGGTDPFSEIDNPSHFQKTLQEQINQATK